MRLAVVIAVLLFVASANALAFSKLKAQRQAALQEQQTASTSTSTSTTHFVLKIVDTPYSSCADIGEANCKKLVDATAAADTKLKAMVAHLTASGRDAHFTAAFGAAATAADVMNCLTTMALDTSALKLYNAWANKDGTVYQAGALNSWGGLAVKTGTANLLVGSAAYSMGTGEMAEFMIHEASHAFCKTIDDHAGKNGYKDSPHFDTVKAANNADSYRVYAQRVSP